VSDRDQRVAITFALPAESSDFVRLLAKPVSAQTLDRIDTIHGQIHGRPVAVLHTGVGEKSCRARIESFLQEAGYRYLISTGFAGALDQHLQAGNLLIAKNFSSLELLQSPHLDRIANRFVFGKLTTVPEIIASESERDRWTRESGAVAVDMETEFIATACGVHGVPMLSLRVISDTPSEPLPAPPEILFDVENQRTNFGRLGYYLVTHPTAFKRLTVFRRQVALARRSLTAALDMLLQVDLID
jgi:adenosylhomocysteine nucleosidase